MAESDVQDLAVIGDSEGALDDGILTLRIALRSPDDQS